MTAKNRLLLGIVECWVIIMFRSVKDIVQLVASLTADPGVASSIPAQSHTFVEIDHEIFSTIILLFPLKQEGLLSFITESMCTKYRLTA